MTITESDWKVAARDSCMRQWAFRRLASANKGTIIARIAPRIANRSSLGPRVR